ncbi:LacI family DNA-binding transcriptional regulator, partial [Streptomyces sp. NRRL F-4489]|uniref:LacI family DNA-binding transcriptional regulator n=1 Tax=Streptomyces sp. NRRL F-4489 TaxID=1609095 RepID=UPI000AA3AD04
PSPPPALSTVRSDDAQAMARILDHLHALGHRRVGHVAGLPGLAHTARRIRSLRTEAARRGLDPGQVRSLTTDYSDAEGAEATRRLLDAPDPPTAIIYDNDVMAVAGASVAADRGLAVPGRLSVVAWDDSPLCRVTHPPLTALVRDTAAFGRLAAAELLALLDGGPPRTVEAELPHLEPRRSTGPPPPGTA